MVREGFLEEVSFVTQWWDGRLGRGEERVGDREISELRQWRAGARP